MKKGIIAAIVLLIVAGAFIIYYSFFLHDTTYINKEGLTVDTRFLLPEGYRRVETAQGSFQRYMQTYPLKKYGKRPKYYNGKTNSNAPIYGVLDKDISPKDLEQCADTCMRLYAEYLYENKEYDKISFNFVSGFTCDYISFAQGKRVKVEGNNVHWYEAASEDYSYKTFREYLDLVSRYANTTSLQRDLEPVSFDDIQIGDIFVMTGEQMGRRLGHAVIVMDICINDDNGHKLYLIGEGTTPASEAYIVGPWIGLDEDGTLNTPSFSCPSQYVRRMG